MSRDPSLPHDWHDLFDPRTLQRGLDYARQGRVTLEERHSIGFASRCRGSGGNNYEQYVEWSSGEIFGQCTCPVGGYCKHLVAALETYRRQHAPGFGRAVSSAQAASWQAWLERLPRASTPAAAPLLGYELLADLRVRVTRARQDQSLPADQAQRTALSPHQLKQYLEAGDALLDEQDRRILTLLLAEPIWQTQVREGLPLQGGLGGETLAVLLASERLWLADDSRRRPLRAAPPQALELHWQELADGSQVPYWQVAGETSVEILQQVWPPYYLDLTQGLMGPLRVGLPTALVRHLQDLPPIKRDQIAAFSLALQERYPQLPPPHRLPVRRLEGIPPGARLRLASHHDRFAYGRDPWTHTASLEFRYAEVVLDGPRATPTNRVTQHPATTEILEVVRDIKAERDFDKLLKKQGFNSGRQKGRVVYRLADDAAWIHFMQAGLPQLREAGWEIHCEQDFQFDFQPVQSWHANLKEGAEHDWFSLELGIQVEGRDIALLPILLRLIRQQPQLLTGLANAEKQVPLLLNLDGELDERGRPLRILLPFERLQPILATLGELFMDTQLRDDALRLSLPDAARLSDLPEALQWQGGERLRAFGERLARIRQSEPPEIPRGLKAELRPYQRTGLGWMQTLGELEAGGILGDDMGLGKTLQTLAYLQSAKEAGRLEQPALVVLPTSLIPNWQDEAARFTPELRVGVLHGQQRQALFERWSEYDLLLTTYALLARDLPSLRERPLAILVLDEAHNIKNPTSKMAQAARALQARQRLCLSGTPLENHLGELWSLFHFLMPGWLGDRTAFNRDYRTPIEKHGNAARLAHLNARIRPFLLRRKKEQVVLELPAKNEMVHWVELSQAQRDRYETVRLAMDAKVRAEIARHGLARSQLVILEALLKLRQICCDPRLLDPKASPTEAHSSKLQSLLDMLDELLAEGRRVLVFSQFTSMLALIEQALRQRGWDYELLTGATRDRRTPVKRFQAGEVPVFLISLKAGGTGLNLTAADTVIHYDPWWNPAVENQATDRAHRIGQDKPVFVYRLISRGTVEERIQRMQQDKARLAAGILEGAPGTELDWQEDDIQALFAPLPS